MNERDEQERRRIELTGLHGEGGGRFNPDTFDIVDAAIEDGTWDPWVTCNPPMFKEDSSFDFDKLRRVRDYLTMVLAEEEQLREQRVAAEQDKLNTLGIKVVEELNSWARCYRHMGRPNPMASWEYPGFIHVRVSSRRHLDFGCETAAEWHGNTSEDRPDVPKRDGVEVQFGSPETVTLRVPEEDRYNPYAVSRLILNAITQLGY
jgi:hypothetical protein